VTAHKGEARSIVDEVRDGLEIVCEASQVYELRAIQSPDHLAERICDSLGGKRTQRGWTVRCPAHDDRHPSLDLAAVDGKLLFICRAGCGQDAVLAALRERGLWPEKGQGTVPETKLGVSKTATRTTSVPKGKPVARYEYRDANGQILGTKIRYEWNEGGERRKSFEWRSSHGTSGLKDGVELGLYRAERVAAASLDTPIHIVEGEKCVHAVESLELMATCGPHGSDTKWTTVLTDVLRGRHVRLLPDNDEPGRKYAEAAANALFGIAASITIVALPGLPEKGDIADWLEGNGA